MDKDKYLATHTFSDQGLEVWRRVVETATQDPKLETLRTQKLVGLVIERLVVSGAMTMEDLDDMLMAII
jgi:hypothetical protein